MAVQTRALSGQPDSWELVEGEGEAGRVKVLGPVDWGRCCVCRWNSR